MKRRPSVVLDLLIMLLAIGIGFFLVTALPRLLPDTVVASNEVPTHTKPSQSYDMQVRPGRLPGYENAPKNQTPEYFCYFFNGNMFASAETPCNVMLENTPGNTCDMMVAMTTEENEEIYRSPVLSPGEYLLYGVLDPLPEAGEHTVNVAILVFAEGGAETDEQPLAVYQETAILTVMQLPQK